ncbi:GNAT family N-acetyltransferase [Paraburkholderia sp. Ac-20347]|uniref:GNAT family N-acetyltransferase n=1 Tax=Paraburkholderia sp. Ac-20347 TaxID=2703892 RepID=UPI00197F8578|nr:GNAT family N-acetyltransferase [Paraburkholderia sp. Ac-20347]MBN3812479.1 GNAT family N-acetyltransferase [Paraburkholderia sp. Ac-20347]
MNVEHFESTVLQSARLSLAPLRAQHAAILFEGLSNPAAYRYIPQTPPVSVAVLQSRYEKLESRRSPDASEAWLNWALIGDDGRARGYVQAIQLAAREAWIAYFVFTPSQRQGYAKEALDALLPVLREVYDIGRFHAEIDTRNIASIRLVESLGFACVRRVDHADEFKGAVSDEYHYALTLSP